MASQTSSADMSLAGQIAELRSRQSFSATVLITELLVFLKASEDSRERYIHLSTQLFYRSAKAYDAINALMAASKEPNGFDWDMFDAYNQAIPALERVLLPFYLRNYPPLPQKHVPDVDDIYDGLKFIEYLFIDREMLLLALDELGSIELRNLYADDDSVFDYETERLRDDADTLDAIHNAFSNATIPALGENLAAATKQVIHDIFQKVDGRPLTKEFSAMIIKSLMLLFIPFSILDNALDEEVKKHLTRTNVWAAMKSFAEDLSIAANTPSQVNLQLEQGYEAVKAELLKMGNSTIDNTANLLELVKLCTRIRLPFRERATVLIKILWRLDQNSVPEDVKTRHLLKQLLEDSVDTLKKIETVVKDVQTVQLSETKDQDEVLNTLFRRIEQFNTTRKVLDTWSQHQQAFDEAFNDDTNHLREMRTVFMSDAP